MDINLNAPINQLGYGIVGTNIFLNLQKKHSVSLWPIGPIDCDQGIVDNVRLGLSNASIFNYTAPSIRIWHQWDMGINVGKGKKCGLTFFEMDKLKKADIHNLDFLDTIFVCSEWAKQIIVDAGINESKVKVVLLGVDKDIFKPCEANNDKTTTLLSIGKWEIRKGHDLILDILEKTFSVEDNFKLIMCCSNPFLSVDEQNQWISFYEKSKFFDKIIVLKNRLATQRDVYELMKKVDIGIFPYRSEAWNLELAEMLSIGKNCIATNYSAPTEYAAKAGCNLIDCDGLEAANDFKWFDGTASWAKLSEKYIENFSIKLRDLHNHKQLGSLEKNVDGIKFFEENTWEKTCDSIYEEISK